ncbi:MAG: YgiT-type zinc finger protein [Pirellulales bacterium]
MVTPTNHEICPVCGGPLVHKVVEKLVRGGVHTAVVNVEADVCQRCGERLYSTEVVRHFEDIRDRLARQDTTGFTPVGQSFYVTDATVAPSQ